MPDMQSEKGNDRFQVTDIREREWKKLDVPAAKLLQLLIDAENIFLDLDDYQMSHNQCYPDIEDMMLQIGILRENYTNFVDSHTEVLNIKQEAFLSTPENDTQNK